MSPTNQIYTSLKVVSLRELYVGKMQNGGHHSMAQHDILQ